MLNQHRAPGIARLASLALLAPLSLAGLTGCYNKSDTPAKQNWSHGGLAANNTNRAFIPKASSGTIGTIEKVDARLDQLIAPGTQMEKLAEGFDWSEGPVWDSKAGKLYFSDVPQNVVYQWAPGKGLSEYARPSGYTGTAPRGGEPGSNGLTLDANGTLVLCQHGDRRIAKYRPNAKSFATVADKYEGKRFNSPNDLCYDKAGNLFFTDPPYGLPKNVDDPTKEIAWQGVYKVSKDGKVTLLTKEMTRPNGIALSPDEKTLYVANSDPKLAIWKAFPINADGTLGEGKVLFDATKWVSKDNKGLPDGLKVDSKGNLWATGPGGVLIFAPDGTHLGTLRTGEATANVAFGDDGSTLYITADMYLVKLKTLSKGW